MTKQVSENLTPALLRKLAESKPPCITVAIQTGGNARARLQDVARQIEAELKASDSTLPPEMFASLHHSMNSADVPNAGGLIFLSSPDFQYRFETDASVPEMVTVEDEFQLRTLLPLLNRKADFYVLALSQNQPRLLHCTESESSEVTLPPSAAKSFNDWRQTDAPDHDLEGRSAGGPGVGSMKGVLFGTSSDHDEHERVMYDYYREIDRGVNLVLKDLKIPLVAVAVDRELALYRKVNTYSDLVEPGVHGAPDGLKGGEMHRRALEAARSYIPTLIRTALDGFDKLTGTGHASSHVQSIVKAAYEGRIAHLFLQETAEYRGAFDERKRKVKKHEDGLTPMRDLLNEAVVQTLRHGGDALVLQSAQMPNGVPVCAVFRYAAPEAQAAMKGVATGSVTSI